MQWVTARRGARPCLDDEQSKPEANWPRTANSNPLRIHNLERNRIGRTRGPLPERQSACQGAPSRCRSGRCARAPARGATAKKKPRRREHQAHLGGAVGPQDSSATPTSRNCRASSSRPSRGCSESRPASRTEVGRGIHPSSGDASAQDREPRAPTDPESGPQPTRHSR